MIIMDETSAKGDPYKVENHRATFSLSVRNSFNKKNQHSIWNFFFFRAIYPILSPSSSFSPFLSFFFDLQVCYHRPVVPTRISPLTKPRAKKKKALTFPIVTVSVPDDRSRICHELVGIWCFLYHSLIHISVILRKCLPCFLWQDRNPLKKKTHTASVHFFLFFFSSSTPRKRKRRTDVCSILTLLFFFGKAGVW